MMASNNPYESPFAQLKRQLQSFGRAAAVGHAIQNVDFCHSSGDYEGVVSFHKISDEMRESLLKFSISNGPKVKQGERDAIE